MKNSITFFLLATALFCSCTDSTDTQNGKTITPLCDGLTELAQADYWLTGIENSILTEYVDSVASTIDMKCSYEYNLLKIYEIQYAIANGVAYKWVNTAVNKYMTSDSALVITNNSTEKDKESFHKAIIQSLLTANESLNRNQNQSEINLHSLNSLAFDVLNAYNTFFFCYYFVTDNQEYLTFFSSNSQTINTLQNYADALFTCGQLSDKEAYKLASTLESTAFLVSMGTLSFNILWNKYNDEIQPIADFFNQYSETTIKALSGNAFESCQILSSEKDYMEYITQAANYKKRIMELVIDGFKHQ